MPKDNGRGFVSIRLEEGSEADENGGFFPDTYNCSWIVCDDNQQPISESFLGLVNANLIQSEKGFDFLQFAIVELMKESPCYPNVQVSNAKEVDVKKVEAFEAAREMLQDSVIALHDVDKDKVKH